MKVSRRAVAKGLAAGTATCLSGLLRAEVNAPEQSPAHAGQAWEPVFPGVWRSRLGEPERYTPVSARLVPAREEAFAGLPRMDAAPLPALHGKRTDRGFMLELPLRPHEHIFGLGLQFHFLDQRGRKKTARVNADPAVDTGDSNAPVPFYVTTEGIGILIDTARYASFYFGDARPKPTHPAGVTSHAVADPTDKSNLEDGDSGQIVVEVPHASGVDVYLFGGPEMIDAVRRYNAFSGGGVLPPDWGLGFWYRMDARSSQQSALALAREFRDRNIPCDVLGLEPGWQTHAYSCTFVWDKERFPNPSGFIDSAAQMNYKVNLWEHAFTHPASPIFPRLEPSSGNFGVWGGLVPDFAGEQARAVFGDYHGRTFVDAGVSGFKLDECDNSDFTRGWSFPECSSFPSGVDGEQMHSVFGLRYQMAIWEPFRKRGRETYSLVRSSGALASPYPFVLYSDLYNHRDFIRALVNSGFSGLLWCPEVRDAVSEEDLIRRLQSVVFSPLAMVNGWYIKNPPWKQLDRKLNNADQLLDGWERLEARCREIIGWRMQLGPYLTAAFQQYAEHGTPPFRALVLDAPKDSRLYRVDDQYMVGDRMMVAPLFAGEPQRSVVLPDGEWCDFWTGEAVGGASSLTVRASAENIPVYVRSGSVIPWAEIGAHAGAPETSRITVRVYGDGARAFTVRRGGRSLRLSWADARGSAEGDSIYSVVAWKKIG